jgi:hypothetical protein
LYKPNPCIKVDRLLDDAAILLGPERASSASCTEEAVFHPSILFWNLEVGGHVCVGDDPVGCRNNRLVLLFFVCLSSTPNPSFTVITDNKI